MRNYECKWKCNKYDTYPEKESALAIGFQKIAERSDPARSSTAPTWLSSWAMRLSVRPNRHSPVSKIIVVRISADAAKSIFGACSQQVFLRRRIIGVVAGVLEHEQPDRRRQIAMLALGVHRTHQLGQVDMAIVCDRAECVPKDVFKADTGLVTAHHQGSFDHARFEMAVVGFFRLS